MFCSNPPKVDKVGFSCQVEAKKDSRHQRPPKQQKDISPLSDELGSLSQLFLFPSLV